MVKVSKIRKEIHCVFVTNQLPIVSGRAV